MSNSFYNHSTYPTPNAPGSSANMRAELDLITAGFNKLPTLSGNGYKVAMINAAGTALIASSALQQLAITQSTIDSTPIGGTTRAAGAFTTLSANGAANLGSSVTIAGGVIDNTIIGGTTPAAGYFTTIVASSMDVGSLIALGFIGPLTGDVTGNVTGNLTGNVSAGSGTSTFNNVTINGTLDMNAGSVGTITGLATPSNSSDAAPKSYVDTQRDTRLALAGGTMSGAIAMGTNRITGLGDPSSTQDASTKNYTDTQDALKLSLAGGTMSGAIAMGTNRITGLGDPVGNQDAATKNYVDSVAQGLDVKPSVRAATTGNITLSGTATIDGVALIVGDRVLVKDQTTTSQNGIYVVAAGGWGRAPDMDAWTELPGAFVFVEDGNTNDNSGWVCTVAPGGTIGTTAVTFEQFSGAGQITAGNGLTKSGNTLNVGTASSGRIVVNADNIDLAASGVTVGTYRSVTVDAYGRVTAGTNPTTLAGYGITDAYTQTQVDTALALKLNLSGGTMSGNIAMGSNRITGLPTPSASNEAATKGYADDGLALKLNLSGGTMSGAIAMGGNKITGLGDPTSNQDAVTLNYVTTLYGSTASAAASASAAATSASNAATSATNASNSATAAANSATAAAASYDSFDDRYLGPKSSDPTVDNDGNALLTGALYWSTSLNLMKAYTGSAWLIAYVPSDFYVPLAGGTMTGPLVINSTLNVTGTTTLGAVSATSVTENSSPVVVQSDIGTAPNEIPLNQHLGSAAYADQDAFYQTSTNVTFRNLVINGEFRISQRGDFSTASARSSDEYTVDRFRCAISGVTANFQHIDATLPDGRSVKAIRIVATSGTSSGYIGFRTTIEEFWRLSGRTITISAWVRTNNAYTGFRHDSTTDISPKFTADSTWRFVSRTYTCPTITQAGRDSNQTTFAVLAYGGSAAVPVASGDFIEVAELQIELGTVATPFERRPYGTELALCQRYFQKSFAVDVAPANGLTGLNTTLNAYGTNNGYLPYITFPVAMRATPSITFYKTQFGSTNGEWAVYIAGSSWTSANAGGTTVNSSNANGFNVDIAKSSAFTTANGYLANGNYTASAEL